MHLLRHFRIINTYPCRLVGGSLQKVRYYVRVAISSLHVDARTRVDISRLVFEESNQLNECK